MLISPSIDEPHLESGFAAEFAAHFEHWRTRRSLGAVLARGFGLSLPLLLPRRFLLIPPLTSPALDPVSYAGLEDLLEEQGDFVLTAPPGSGKTTELWRLGRSVAQALENEEIGQFPVYISLSRYQAGLPILEFLRKELLGPSRIVQSIQSYPACARLAENLEEYLEDGRVLLLLDGLDEMPRAGFASSIRRWAAFRDQYPENGFVFACRAEDYLPPLDLPRVEIAEIDGEAQARVDPESSSLAGGFSDWLGENPAWARLARRPFWLLLLRSMRKSMPSFSTPAQLLLGFLKKIWNAGPVGKSEEAKADSGMQVLAQLALTMHDEFGASCVVNRAWAEAQLRRAPAEGTGPSAIDTGEILSLASDAGIIELDAEGDWRFTHPLFEEGLAAWAVAEFDRNGEALSRAVRRREWDGVLAAVAGLHDATELVKRLSPIDPFLAAHCAAGAASVDSRAVKALAKRLTKALESPFRLERLRAARALVELKAEEAVTAIIALVESDPESDAEISRILLDLPEELLLPHLFPRLRDESASWRGWAVRMLGDLAVPHALASLVRLTNDPDPAVRVQVAPALSRVVGPAAVPYLFWLLRDAHPVVRMAAAQTLLQFSPPVLLAGLTSMPEYATYGRAARGGGPGQEALLSRLVGLLRDNNREVRWVASEILIGWRGEGLVAFLAPLLNDDDQHVRWLAGRMLGRCGGESAVPLLTPLLTKPDAGSRVLAAHALAQMLGTRALPHLLPLLADEQWQVRATVVEICARLSAVEAIPHLLPLLRDPDEFVRHLTTDLLVSVRSEQGAPDLIRSLDSENPEVRRIAAQVLGQLGTPLAAPALTRALKDSAQEVRAAAAQALGEIEQDRAIPLLIPLLQDPQDSVRTSAAETLQRLGPSDSRGALARLPRAQTMQFMAVNQDRDAHREFARREEGATIEGMMGQVLANNPQRAVTFFVELLQHPDPPVRQHALRTLAANAGESHLPLLEALLDNPSPLIADGAYEIIDLIRRRLYLPKERPRAK